MLSLNFYKKKKMESNFPSHRCCFIMSLKKGKQQKEKRQWLRYFDSFHSTIPTQPPTISYSSPQRNLQLELHLTHLYPLFLPSSYLLYFLSISHHYSLYIPEFICIFLLSTSHCTSLNHWISLNIHLSSLLQPYFKQRKKKHFWF